MTEKKHINIEIEMDENGIVSRRKFSRLINRARKDGYNDVSVNGRRLSLLGAQVIDSNHIKLDFAPTIEEAVAAGLFAYPYED